jgi:hypothetical protein
LHNEELDNLYSSLSIIRLPPIKIIIIINIIIIVAIHVRFLLSTAGLVPTQSQLRRAESPESSEATSRDPFHQRV